MFVARDVPCHVVTRKRARALSPSPGASSALAYLPQLPLCVPRGHRIRGNAHAARRGRPSTPSRVEACVTFARACTRASAPISKRALSPRHAEDAGQGSAGGEAGPAARYLGIQRRQRGRQTEEGTGSVGRRGDHRWHYRRRWYLCVA